MKLQSVMAAVRQHSCRVCGKEISDHRECRVLHSSANKDVLPVLEEFLSQGGINPTEISQTAGGGPWICKHPCYKELKRVQELQNELQKLDSKLRGKICATYRVESIPVTFTIRDPRGNVFLTCASQCRLLLTIKVQACQL